MDYLSFVIPCTPPSVNRRFTPRKGRPYSLSEDVKTFYDIVAFTAIQHGFTPLTGKLFAQVDIYRVADRGDIDNYGKALWDSLQGILYMKDSQIKRSVVTLHVDKKHPRTEVVVCAFRSDLYSITQEMGSRMK